MSEPFRFKQFSVADDRCGQKVGTDSILLGSWATATNVHRVLDIGTGSGLLALMQAQRFSNAKITAIEIDSSAFEQAQQNFSSSPWANRLTATHADARQFTSVKSFDLIVCNPPYFEASFRSDHGSRTIARHEDRLTFADLTKVAATLLNQQGRFCAVLPFDRAFEFTDIATQHQLHLVRRCDVRPTPSSEPKRSLLAYGLQKTEVVDSKDLVLEESRHQYAAGYVKLAKEFLLKM
ncbi:MAG: methyltransferase [Fuerstiella sp.]